MQSNNINNPMLNPDRSFQKKKITTDVASINVVMSDHANNERALNKWLQQEKRRILEKQEWYQGLTDQQKVI